MSNLLGVILVGGLSRRMGGGDKTLLYLAGQPMLDHVIKRIGPQITQLVINANGDLSRFAMFNLPLIPDSIPDYAGPLAGILSAMEYGREAGYSHLVSVSGDTPFLPLDLVQKLLEPIRKGADIALASSNGRTHPVVGIWPLFLEKNLRDAMVHENLRKIDFFTARYKTAIIEFEASIVDPFFNINTKEEWAEAEQLLRKV